MTMAVAKADGFVDVDDEQSDVDQEIAENIRQLPEKAQHAFYMYIEDILSGNKMTDKAFAQKIGYTYQHFSVLKTSPCWVRAFQLIMINSAISRTLANTEEYISNLERLAKDETNANKALLQVSGVLKTQSGINININKSDNRQMNSENPVEMMDRMIISLGKLGVSSDAIVDRYIQLKNEGAF